MIEARRITVRGRVQGVGFRPFVYEQARLLGLKGTVQNNMDGVRIVVEGEPRAIDRLLMRLKKRPPRLSRVDQVLEEKVPVKGYRDFVIQESDRRGDASVVIPVDAAVCEECLEEMFDPGNFRYRYPFINCTQCGPRYTIIEELPYDRPFTAMKSFTMCERCASEYHDAGNRRHHAQPIACPECGPKLILFTIGGEKLAEGERALQEARIRLERGEIVAVKGLGGYHLACDAFDEAAVRRLREGKRRPRRPLAVMVRSLEEARRLCLLSEAEEKMLASPESPIVILDRRSDAGLPELLAPGLGTLGVMLPYTPLHHLLFADGSLRALVMTSANPSGLPILYRDEEAFHYLADIADAVLSSDREILHPIDDSVVRVRGDVPLFYRRSRGFVPDSLPAPHPVDGVVALGGQQKNVFAIGRGNQIFLGPHIGDMDSLEVIDRFQREFRHLLKWLGIRPKAAAVDLHPGYSTWPLAREMGIPVVPVQHHHAHLVACQVDNGVNEPCFGIILDGTGYGLDGKIWGFEILYGDARSFERLAHLRYTPLPGSERAVREPWRNAAGMLADLFGEEGVEWAKRLFPERMREIDVIAQMTRSGINSPLAGTCGRLFDAVSALLGVCRASSYDGEAAIRLSELGRKTEDPEAGEADEVYPHALRAGEGGLEEIDFSPMLRELIRDRFSGVPVARIVEKFQRTVARVCVERVLSWSERRPGLNRSVALSGGSFHNEYLSQAIADRLRRAGFRVYTHRRVPPSDGGLAIGQLVIASRQDKAHSEEEGSGDVHGGSGPRGGKRGL
ncbi:MAG: carbamoyltransferase HypF [Thermoactinomycetaceae bacterium]|nr:carbamoyltransferase HypF [Thermoactinomycetaceae bacterium]